MKDPSHAFLERLTKNWKPTVQQRAFFARPTIWAAKWNMELGLSDEGAAQGANDPFCRH